MTTTTQVLSDDAWAYIVRSVLDNVRSAYDKGYNDARRASAVAGDSAPGYQGRATEADRSNLILSAILAKLSLASASSCQAILDNCAPQVAVDVEPLLAVLRFYARGEHYSASDDDFDTVSGEPQNWLCSTRDDDATMIEDGEVARSALLGRAINWIDGGEDETPRPIEGEIDFARHAAPQVAADERAAPVDAPLSALHADYWLANRQNIIDAVERAGFEILSNHAQFWLRRINPAAEVADRARRMADAGYTRRPSWRSLPSDDDEPAAQPSGEAGLFEASTGEKNA